ncbi:MULTISPECIES: hypothetical protein [Caproicibacterium]|uniref:Uncharacterized protein n=1 Tax=Caproicibacterium argilliputei TaxID=3030016 RepID=A0AA97D9U1_9FIRM|nr:hypothetical protein [Caproicibacterium argilliputei]WOC32409.1 hypothetical protein PXC00_00650 [Caproicibacterium argilliputei]
MKKRGGQMNAQAAGLLLAAPFWSAFGMLPSTLCHRFFREKAWQKRLFGVALVLCALGAAAYYAAWTAVGGMQGLGPGMADMTDSELWRMTLAAAVALGMLAVDFLQLPLYLLGKRVRPAWRRRFGIAAIACSAAVSVLSMVPLLFSL